MLSNRIFVNEKRKMFIPINVEGAGAEKTATFWNPMKSFYLILILGAFVIMNMVISGSPIGIKIVFNLAGVLISIPIIRLLVLEEKFYTKLYKRKQKYSNATSGICWGITHTDDNGQGAIVSYYDGYLGVFVKLSKGSKVGQQETFEEKHRDKYSDFVKTCMQKGYMFMFIDTMENAGKDKRLENLAKENKKERNPRLRELRELDLGLMKRRAEETYYDSDCILIYTTKASLIKEIRQDAIDITKILLGAGYRALHIMSEEEIIDLHKETTGTEVFDLVNAKVDLFETEHKSSDIAISKLVFNTGEVVEVDKAMEQRIIRIYNRLKNGEEIPDILKEIFAVKSERVETVHNEIVAEEENKKILEQEEVSEKVERKVVGSSKKEEIKQKPKQEGDKVIDF